MKVRVIVDNGRDYFDFEYFSEFTRINAKGIKDEIAHEMLMKYGSSARYMTIKDFYRVDD